MSKTYKVTLPFDFLSTSRRRAGVVVPAGKEGFVGGLSDEQLETIKADKVFAVEEIKSVETKTTAPKKK